MGADGLFQSVTGGTVGLQPGRGGIPQRQRFRPVLLQGADGRLQLGDGLRVVPAGHRVPYGLHLRVGGGTAGLRVVEPGRGSKNLLVQLLLLPLHGLRLPHQHGKPVGLLAGFQVLALQLLQILVQPAVLGGQRCRQLRPGEELRLFAGVQAAPAGEKAVAVLGQALLQRGGTGHLLPGGTAGGIGGAARSAQRPLTFLQLGLGHMVFGQHRRLGVPGAAAHGAGLAGLQFLRQQTRPVGVQLPLHGGEPLLRRVQLALGGLVLLLRGRGGPVGLVGLVHHGQQALAQLPQCLVLLDLPVQPGRFLLRSAQLGAGGLVFLLVFLQCGGLRLQGVQRPGGLGLHLGGVGGGGLRRGQLLPLDGPRLRDAHAGLPGGNFFVQHLQRGAQLLLRLFVLLQQRPGQRQRTAGLLRVGVLLQPGQLLAVGGEGAQMQQHLVGGAFPLGLRLLPFGGGVLPQTLQIAGAEQLPQNGVPLAPRGVQQPGAVILRQQRHLHELRCVQTQQFGDGGGHFRVAVEDGLVFPHQLRPGGTALLRPAAHRDGLLLMGEHQLHKGLGVRRRVVAAQHGGATIPSGGHAVQRKGDGVKQRGLARAGVPRDEEQPPVPEGGKVQRGDARIGAEGAKGQTLRFHHSASFRFCRSACRARRSASVMPRPFCMAKKSPNSSSRGLPSGTASETARPGGQAYSSFMVLG